MTKYFANNDNSPVFKVNFEEEKFDLLKYGTGVDYFYVLDEDGILTIKDKDTKTIEVKAGDILLKMYGAVDTCDREFFVFHCDDLFDYYNRRNKHLEECKNASLSDKVCSDCDAAC